jgi:hypothetical protein
MSGARFLRPKSNAAFTSNRQRPQKKTLPVWAKVSLTTLPLSPGPEILLVLTTLTLRCPPFEAGHRSSYSPLEGRRIIFDARGFYHGSSCCVNARDITDA